jgi:hypothetical protein
LIEFMICHPECNEGSAVAFAYPRCVDTLITKEGVCKVRLNYFNNLRKYRG